MTPRIVLVGAGGHAKSIICALEAKSLKPHCLYDDNPGRHGQNHLGYEVQGGVADLMQQPRDGLEVIVSIALNPVRSKLTAELRQAGFNVVGIVHPTAIVSPRAVVAPTAQLLAGVIVNGDAVIGEHSVLNTGCLVEHDCHIGDFVHLGPRATLAGAVSIGHGAFIGSAVTVVPFLKIGEWSVVGAGSVVTREVPEHTTVAGVPARPL